MSMTEQMAGRIEKLFALRDELLISNAEWARRTLEITPDGVDYQTIRRIERGGTPYGRTVRVLELALMKERERQNELVRATGGDSAVGA